MEVKVTEGQNYYFFETEEQKNICPKCKREYKRRKRCLKCKTPTKIITKRHTGTITKDLSKYSCSCIFSSWFRWGKYWREIHPNSTCKHVKSALKRIKNGN